MRSVQPTAPTAPLPPRRVHAPQVLAELRAEDDGMRRPAAPLPRPVLALDTIAYLAAVSTAIHADYKRHLDTLRVLDDISAALTEHPELLTAAGHPGPRLLLRRIAAELAPYAAEWNTMVPEATPKAGASK